LANKWRGSDEKGKWKGKKAPSNAAPYYVREPIRWRRGASWQVIWKTVIFRVLTRIWWCSLDCYYGMETSFYREKTTLVERWSEKDENGGVSFLAKGMRGDKHRENWWWTHHFCGVNPENCLLPTLLICGNTRS